MSGNSANTSIQPATVSWSEGLPLSTQFDDVYYSRENGLLESCHVFIDGNNLPERWQTLEPSSQFSIFETGFGTGLNFLCAARLWLDAAPESAVLHFVSAEKYPLTRDALSQALANWSQLAGLSAELIDNYPPMTPGVHRRWLFDGRVCLTLVFDDAVAGFTSLLRSDHPEFRQAGPHIADAWFLDGFTPAKNPDLWSSELFQLVACFSRETTTLATFTVARIVRDGLQGGGFTLHKTPGYGRKREMLRGKFSVQRSALPDPKGYQPPKVLRNGSYQPPWYLSIEDTIPGKSVAIIGAGIAGCSAAAALAKRGFKVSIYDIEGAPGMGASGNPQGILYPKLSTENSPLAHYGLHALCFSHNYYKDYWQSEFPGSPCGVIVLPEGEHSRQRFEQLGTRFKDAPDLVRPLRRAEIGTAAGIDIAAKIALLFPGLGWVSPKGVCHWLLNGTPVNRHRITNLHQRSDTGQWQLQDDHSTIVDSVDHVVITNSYRANQLGVDIQLPFRPVRGQITCIPSSSASTPLKAVLCGAGYLAPAMDGYHTLGATYGMNETDTDIRAEDHQHNLSSLSKTDAALETIFGDATSTENLQGRAAVRCTTPDYLPVVGQIPDVKHLAARFASLGRNAKADIPLSGSYLPGLWISAGHGSRGLTYAPLAAEMLAAQMNNEISPIPRTLTIALSPARFIIRNLKRNQFKAP